MKRNITKFGSILGALNHFVKNTTWKYDSIAPILLLIFISMLEHCLVIFLMSDNKYRSSLGAVILQLKS